MYKRIAYRNEVNQLIRSCLLNSVGAGLSQTQKSQLNQNVNALASYPKEVLLPWREAINTVLISCRGEAARKLKALLNEPDPTEKINR
jgi:hypothetical protein